MLVDQGHLAADEHALLEGLASKHLEKHGNEPRRSLAARSSVGWPVTFWRDGAQNEGTLRDLSRGGFFIRTPVRQPVGARIEVSFEVPGDKRGRNVVAEAIVVRIGEEPDRGLGCRFFRITAGPRGRLEECLQLLERNARGETNGRRRRERKG